MYKSASLLLGACVVAVAPAFAEASLPAEVRAAIGNGDYSAAEAALKEQLRGKGLSTEDAQTMHLCMLLELIRETGARVLTEFAASDPSRAEFLSVFAEDAEWLGIYLSAGLVPHQTDVGVDVLHRIWKDREGKVENKQLAVALASVWGGGETAPNPPVLQKDPAGFNPVWRYNFFVNRQKEGLLHPNFPNLRAWELRFVVGIPGQDWDDLSYQWAAENINVPWDKYNYACWAATYTDTSKFGDSVQCGLYNMPFADEGNAQTTQTNGGVCGALSHLGAVAAMAHGIPAYTAGQPGHCAYAVRLSRGNWEGGFGGPDGGMHNHIFGSQAPTSYNLMEAVFADDATVEAAYRHSYVARAKEAAGDVEGAMESWRNALAGVPLHPFFRAQLHRLMVADGCTPEACAAYLQETLPLYKGHGFAAADMMESLSPLINRMTDTAKAGLYAQVHGLIAGTPSSWALTCEGLLKKQFGTLEGDAAKQDLLGRVLAAHINSEDGTVFGQLLEWAVKEYVEKGKADIFAHAFSVAAKSGKAVDKQRRNSMTKAYGKAIIATEAARSALAFQALNEAAVQALGAPEQSGPPKETAAMKGTLAKAVLFRISTTSPWDTPHMHAGILAPGGGKCHTAKETSPNFIVELERQGELASCLVRKVDGFEGRMQKAAIYTSEDGATWVKRAETERMPKVWVVDFPAGTKGKWVKIEFDNPQPGNFAHISHFLISTK